MWVAVAVSGGGVQREEPGRWSAKLCRLVFGLLTFLLLCFYLRFQLIESFCLNNPGDELVCRPQATELHYVQAGSIRTM